MTIVYVEKKIFKRKQDYKDNVFFFFYKQVTSFINNNRDNNKS